MTETMNEADMSELQTMSFSLLHNIFLTIDDVTTALLYKMRQVVIVEEILPRTAMNGIVYASIRLEI